ncbi:ureidoglycolate lyase [Synechococcus sp. H55.7]|uniref:ureidoglycolate lyase n=1 Tax=unclassified Synechococcus TaxID=2626047 RepID=UPI0039C3F7C4
MSTTATTVVRVPIVEATPENVRPFGQLLGDDVAHPGLGIPFYQGRVLEGQNIDFQYTGKAVIRTAKILPGYPPVLWLERHLRMTQLFVGLGQEPFIMVMAPPNHPKTLPDLDKVQALRFPPGHGLLLHRGTWHDFPVAGERPVVVLTANSEEVVEALASMTTAQEMDQGDVFKISLPQRLNAEIHLQPL